MLHLYLNEQLNLSVYGQNKEQNKVKIILIVMINVYQNPLLPANIGLKIYLPVSCEQY